MMKLYEYGQPPAAFIEFIEPELKKMEEDPNNPMFQMLKDMVPQGQNQGQGQDINMQQNLPNEEMPPECKQN